MGPHRLSDVSHDEVLTLHTALSPLHQCYQSTGGGREGGGHSELRREEKTIASMMHGEILRTSEERK